MDAFGSGSFARGEGDPLKGWFVEVPIRSIRESPGRRQGVDPSRGPSGSWF
jgi:hypothetical protein